MRSNLVLSFVLAIWSAVVWGGGCSEQITQGDGESHFLSMCPPGCGAGLDCICGVCTKACTANETCTSLAGNATCVERLDCAVPRECDVACSADRDCGTGYACANGFCRRGGSTDASTGPDGESTKPGTGSGGAGAAPRDGAAGTVSTGGNAGSMSTGGNSGAGGSTSDCTLPLSEFMCPATYGAALADWKCSFDDGNPAFGTCGTLHLFGHGHDGYTTCAYDGNTGALAGAISGGMQLPSSPCAYYTAGVLTSTSCPNPTTPPDPNTPPCSKDAGVRPAPDAGLLGYACQARQAIVDPGGDGTVGGACCGGLGACTPATAFEKATGSSTFKHDTCKRSSSGDLLCAPRTAKDGGAVGVLFERCAIPSGNQTREGRCVPGCFLGTAAVNALSTDGCSQSDGVARCAPCFDPVDATPTGVCSQNGDRPTMPAPAPQKTCGSLDADGGPPLGTCVAIGGVLGAGNGSTPSLQQDDCDSGSLCVPTLKVKDPGACFAECVTGLSPGSIYEEGACVPAFIARDISPASLAILHQSSCGSGELCTPCANPLQPGEPTDICN